MITVVMKGDELLFASHAELPAEYFNPIFDKDETCDLHIYRYIRTMEGDDTWFRCTAKHGFDWIHVQESEVPAAARLAGTIGGL